MHNNRETVIIPQTIIVPTKSIIVASLAARVVKEGQCSGRKGPGKGRSPAAARAPL